MTNHNFTLLERVRLKDTDVIGSFIETGSNYLIEINKDDYERLMNVILPNHYAVAQIPIGLHNIEKFGGGD